MATSAPPDLARIRLRARGGGLDSSAAPNRSMFKRGRLAGMLLRPRRSGDVRLSATIDCALTNTLSVPVLAAYHGGCPGARGPVPPFGA